MLHAASSIAKLAYDEERELSAALDHAQSELFQLVAFEDTRQARPFADELASLYEQVQQRTLEPSSQHLVPVGFVDLQRMLGGFHPSDLILLAGRPAMGKTSLALSMATHIARQGFHVGFFSLEMSATQLVQRVVAGATKIDTHTLRVGQLGDEEWRAFADAAGRLSDLPIIIDDAADLTVFQLRSKARRMQRRHGLDIVILDYLQLMNSGLPRVESRVQEVSYISRSLKALARELNVPVIALSQLSRAVEQRSDRRPQLSDLRDSGALEQDADIVVFIYRDEVYHPDTDRPHIAEVIVAKHRTGPTGAVDLFFDRRLTRFFDLQRAS
jgi:replicative DNA helicase